MPFFDRSELPDTSTPPDNTYFDTRVISWDFAVDGHKATLGVIQPDFNEIFPIGEGGERITLVEPAEGASLSLTELGGKHGKRVDQMHELEADGQTAFIPGGKNMQVRTAGKVVEYVCIYPGQPAEE